MSEPVVYVWVAVRIDPFGRPRVIDRRHGVTGDKAVARLDLEKRIVEMGGQRSGALWEVTAGRVVRMYHTHGTTEDKYRPAAERLLDDEGWVWITEARRLASGLGGPRPGSGDASGGDRDPGDAWKRVKAETETEAGAVNAAHEREWAEKGEPPVEPVARIQLWDKLPGVQLVTPSAVNDPAKRRMDFLTAQKVTRSAGVKVAVLDTGCRRTHPSLTPLVFPVIDATGRGGGDVDVNGHGTFCVSQIVGDTPADDPFGTSTQVTVYPIQVLDSAQGWGADSWIARGVRAAVRLGVQVISMSIGGESPMPLTAAAIAEAIQAGITVFAAAGNGGAGLPDVSYPARLPEVVAVGAVDDDGRPAQFSQRGPSLDVWACGVAQYGATSGETHGRWSGTSMACPHAASGGAMIYGVYRELHGEWPTPRLVLDLLAVEAAETTTDGGVGGTYAGIVQVGESLKSIQVPTPPPTPTPPELPTETIEYSADSIGRMIAFHRIFERLKAGDTFAVIFRHVPPPADRAPLERYLEAFGAQMEERYRRLMVADGGDWDDGPRGKGRERCPDDGTPEREAIARAQYDTQGEPLTASHVDRMAADDIREKEQRADRAAADELADESSERWREYQQLKADHAARIQREREADKAQYDPDHFIDPNRNPSS